MTDILKQDAAGQLSALESGEISARELLQACVDRADATSQTALQASLQAFLAQVAQYQYASLSQWASNEANTTASMTV